MGTRKECEECGGSMTSVLSDRSTEQLLSVLSASMFVWTVRRTTAMAALLSWSPALSSVTPVSISMATCWSGRSSWSWKWGNWGTTCTYMEFLLTCVERRYVFNHVLYYLWTLKTALQLPFIFVKEELVELVLCQQASLSDSVADTPTADNFGETTIQHDLNCHITSDVPDLSTPSLISEDGSAPPESPTPPTHVTNLEPDFQERDQVNSFLKGDMGIQVWYMGCVHVECIYRFFISVFFTSRVCVHALTVLQYEATEHLTVPSG